MRPPHIATSLTASKTPEDLNGNEGVILGELQVHDVNEKPPPAANMDHLDKDAAAQLPRDDVLRVGGRQRVCCTSCNRASPSRNRLLQLRCFE
jgi:hypothetical protein